MNNECYHVTKHNIQVSVFHLLPFFHHTDEITNSFRRYGHLVVDWPHKAESKSYFPPKGNSSLTDHNMCFSITYKYNLGCIATLEFCKESCYSEIVLGKHGGVVYLSNHL